MNKMSRYFCFLAIVGIIANAEVENIKDSIIRLLEKNNPTVLPQFHIFYQDFDELIHSFFDKKDNRSLSEHIKRMERKITTLNEVCRDPAFSSIHGILKKHTEHVKDLVEIFKLYVGSRNSLAFAWKVKRFEYLLPSDIKKRGHFSIFRSLHHRLMC